MLKCTKRWCVVFTQGFPVLERFAQVHFLPSNPFSTSCIWLDEDDFRNVSFMANKYQVASPLRIDPYAHHPTLSPYAVKSTKKKKKTSAAQTNSLDDHDGHAADTETTDVQHLLGTLEGSCGRAHPETPSPAPAGKAAAAVRRGRGRPRKVAAPAPAVVSAEHVTAVDVYQYHVPICSLPICKPLFLFNLDQMYLNIRSGADAQPFSTPLADSSCIPLDRVGFGGADVSSVPHGLRPSASLSYSLSSDFATSRVPFTSDEVTEGIRMLQAKYPNAPGSSNTMYSIATRKAYGGERQMDLRKLATKHQYRSIWWATRRQWSLLDAFPRPGQKEHVLPVYALSKLVHVSLLDDPENVLRHSFISSRTRRLTFVFEDGQDDQDAVDNNLLLRGTLASGGSFGSVPNSPDLLFAKPRKRCSYSEASKMLHDDMERMGYQIPLYLRKDQIASLGGSLRPGVHGVSMERPPTPVATEAEGDDMTNPQLAGALRAAVPGEASTTRYRCWYHLSQVHFPSSYLLSSAVLAEEMRNVGVALHGTTGARLPYPELTYDALVNQHPEIAAVLHTGAQTTSTAIGEEAGVSSRVVEEAPSSTSLPTLVDGENADSSTNSVGNTNPITDARVPPQQVTEDDDALVSEQAIAAFVASHASPKLVTGRHLWFRAEDVLAANGVVDVNSAPVEVWEDRAGGGVAALPGGSEGVMSGLLEDVPDHMLFNVECLANPDDALRKLSAPFKAS